MLADAALLELADQDLLNRFARTRDEEAFAALVERHGPMVLGVCRRVLQDECDAEDAFQATFLVLARKANGIRKREAVGSWLYGVAYRVANKLRVLDEEIDGLGLLLRIDAIGDGFGLLLESW